MEKPKKSSFCFSQLVLALLFCSLSFLVSAQNFEEQDLGVVHYSEAPKNWTITVPTNFTRVEVGVYGASAPDNVQTYQGWHAYMRVNGESLWEWV
ncbi:MAG TPA: hypothetical protein QGI39_06050, partial [Gammaproteobacteria bacterium]|nr:hypothetical protein [Gammaproteobacteria bacterium]